MTKAPRKTIMKRSELESKCLKNKSYQSMKIYKCKKTFCSKLYKKERKKFYSKIDAREITDKKSFWKQLAFLFLAKLLV